VGRVLRLQRRTISSQMTLLVDTSVWSLRCAVTRRRPNRRFATSRALSLVEKSSSCRQAGAQIGTVDALIAQLCIRHELTLLTTDKDFTHAAKHCQLCVWPARMRARR
jgi:predicted nuclease of predicted toxin-antitoxin system